jgi:hypothetical protein
LGISQHRLDDLFKEYDGVLPGLNPHYSRRRAVS